MRRLFALHNLLHKGQVYRVDLIVDEDRDPVSQAVQKLLRFLLLLRCQYRACVQCKEVGVAWVPQKQSVPDK